MADTTPPAQRTHGQCRRCRGELDASIAHCDSRTCPWCRACGGEAKP